MNMLDYPQRIAIELTPLCNLSCAMCPRHHITDTTGFITEELWFKLIDDISRNSPDTVVLPFWRGESLLHPQFLRLLEYALSKSIRIHVSTNGLLIDEKFADLLCRCEFVNISIHTVSGLKQAQSFSKLLKYKATKKPDVQISFVTGENTVRYLDDVILSRNLQGFDSVRLYKQHTINGDFGGIGTSLDVPRTYCAKLLDTLVIAYDGAISRCSHIWTPEQGPDLNQMSIQEAWESQVMEKIRKDYPDPYCAGCDQWMGRTLGESWRMEDGMVEQEKIWPSNEI
ncbi:radical SAM protein [Cohnella suwonensis]|uniref:Radical SAM protein n=1 Tax=Cohnella suwonensis TaxID=696072 RepID=A0ABW0LYB2_9BACL